VSDIDRETQAIKDGELSFVMELQRYSEIEVDVNFDHCTSRYTKGGKLWQQSREESWD
jgi:acyl carrier protein phosphodiesterase